MPTALQSSQHQHLCGLGAAATRRNTGDRRQGNRPPASCALLAAPTAVILFGATSYNKQIDFSFVTRTTVFLRTSSYKYPINTIDTNNPSVTINTTVVLVPEGKIPEIQCNSLAGAPHTREFLCVVLRSPELAPPFFPSSRRPPRVSAARRLVFASDGRARAPQHSVACSCNKKYKRKEYKDRLENREFVSARVR